MQALRTANTFRLGSIDDYLGPSTGRFFGNGYRRVRYRDRSVAHDAAAGTPTRARVGIEYPIDWSVKARSTPLRPHLSTIDALVLAANVAECHLGRIHTLSVEQRRRAWLRRVTIRAAATPFESGLDELPVE